MLLSGGSSSNRNAPCHPRTLHRVSHSAWRKEGHLSHAGGRLLQRVVVEAVVHEHGHQVAVLRVHDVAPQLPRAHLRSISGIHWPQCCVSAANQHPIMHSSSAAGCQRTLGFWPLIYAAAICTCGRCTGRSRENMRRCSIEGTLMASMIEL